MISAALLFVGAVGSEVIECDVEASGPVCMNGGANILLPGGVASGLSGYWNFNEEEPYDASGSGNHGVSALIHGPAPAGLGYSAVFERNFMMVPDSQSFASTDFTYSFWVFIPDAPRNQAQEAPSWCPLIRKGVYVTEAAEFANAPALLFSRRTGHLRASLTTSTSSHGFGEHLDSNARVLPNRWVHLAVVHHGAKGSVSVSRLLVYVNGILDASLALKGTVELNNYPLYVGGDPFTAEACNFKVYIDDVKLFSHAAAPHELQAEAAPALAGIDPSYVHLGCLSCTLAEAMQSCPGSRHVCSSLELHTGGYQVARALGWLVGGVHVWTHAAVARRAATRLGEAVEGVPSQGLALCCEGGAASGAFASPFA